jgi:DNA-binding NtrC family response regulator
MAKILVIDDDAAIRDVIFQLLQDGGHTLTMAENGREGVALFRANRPDLVITDIIMPEQEGIETLKQIRQIQPDAKVVVVSGGGRLGNEPYLDVARAMGALDTIEKPFDPDDFIRRIARCLAGG